MKKKKKINYFQIFLILLFMVSLIMYVKLYILNNEEPKVIDLPSSVTNVTWYEYGTLASMKFSSGSFLYNLEEDEIGEDGLRLCNRYYYNENNKTIRFDCANYTMKLISVSKYRLIMVISNGTGSKVYTYYNSKELTSYLMDNNINELTDEEIEKIMEDNDFTISKTNKSEDYKIAQLSKLSSIDELSIDQYLALKDSLEKSIVLVINPNMSVDSYDLIPLFMNWKNIYNDYKFYFVNGTKLTINDYDLLERDKVLKDYLVGLYDSNILIFEDGVYKRISVDVFIEGYEDKVFNCLNEECDQIEIKIYDSEREYSSIDEVLNRNL